MDLLRYAGCVCHTSC
ncbi:hypothetical protein [Streptomyces montanus]